MTVLVVVLANLAAAQPCVDLRPTLAAAAQLLEARYVLPEAGRAGAKALAAASHDAAHVCGDADAQAGVLTQLVRAAIPDWHLRVMAGDPPPKSPPPEAPGDDHGLVEVSRLAGGVGYLRLSELDDMHATLPYLESALRLLRTSTGVIIDVRGAPGGDGGTAELLVRSFLPSGSPAPFHVYDRAGKQVDSTPHEPTWPRLSCPVVVLVDRGTASAAEVIAYALREEAHATIIGTRTLGAAHQVRDVVKLLGGFSLAVAEYRMVGRRSGTDWERVGVVPDVQAVDRDALLLAWERLRKP